ncbi:hypothetical protein P7C70_g2645, partial [Phenoliferia sp. Uapishka_3]
MAGTQVDLFTLSSVLSFSAVLVLLLISHLSSRLLPSQSPTAQKFIFSWLAFDALIHFTFEGSFLALSFPPPRTVLTASPSAFKTLWKEYAVADTRWGTADPTVVALELLTVLGAGPLYSKDGAYADQDCEPRIVLSTAEIYGGWMTVRNIELPSPPNLASSSHRLHAPNSFAQVRPDSPSVQRGQFSCINLFPHRMACWKSQPKSGGVLDPPLAPSVSYEYDECKEKETRMQEGVVQAQSELKVWRREVSRLQQEIIALQGRIVEQDVALQQLRNPSGVRDTVCCVLDGDGFIFDRSFVERGDQGGRDAAKQLYQHIENTAKELNITSPMIFVFLFCNLSGLSFLLERSRLGSLGGAIEVLRKMALSAPCNNVLAGEKCETSECELQKSVEKAEGEMEFWREHVLRVEKEKAELRVENMRLKERASDLEKSLRGLTVSSATPNSEPLTRSRSSSKFDSISSNGPSSLEDELTTIENARNAKKASRRLATKSKPLDASKLTMGRTTRSQAARTRPETRSSMRLNPSLGHITPPSTLKRDASHSSVASPARQASARPPPALRLDTLPADVLYRIAELLAPPLSAHELDGSGVLSSSFTWVDPGFDLLRFASTCRVVYRAVNSRIGVHFGLKMRNQYLHDDPWLDVVDIALDARQSAGGPSTIRDTPSEDHALLPPLLFHPFAQSIPFSGHRIRHFHIHALADTEQSVFLAEYLFPHTPRLETFAFVHMSIDEVVCGDFWNLLPLDWAMMRSLARHCPDLKEIYLSGLAVGSPKDDFEDVKFGKKLETITLAVAGDHLCNLARMAPGLKNIVVWREFTTLPMPKTTDQWWVEDAWRTVEKVELRGFSGNTGRPLLQSAFKKLRTLRTLIADAAIPLRSLNLSEPHPIDTLKEDVLPFLEGLPHLKSFSFLSWRTRSFNPAFFTSLAEKLPHLEELGAGVETEGLHWWAGNIDDFAKALSHFQHLHTFTWNHTPYSDLSFAAASARAFLKGVAVRVAADSPLLRTIRWFGQAVHLMFCERTLTWEWSDEDARLKEAELMAAKFQGKGKGKETASVKVKDKGKGRKRASDVFRGLEAWGANGLGKGKAKVSGTARVRSLDADENEEDSGFFDGMGGDSESEEEDEEE